MTRVVVQIDRLVLKGFRHRDRDAVAEGLRRELEAALSTPTVARRVARVGAVDRLRGGQVGTSDGMTPREIGVGTARRIASALAP